jgi:hypothetical protein
MPFVVHDPWRVQYFANVPCRDDVFVPVDDLDCWEFYPDLRFIYDKLFITQSQGIAGGTHGDLPKHFPVFAKPRINLKGMGKASFIVRNETEFRGRMTDGMMWMELLDGPHISTDCAVVEGKVAWVRHATGEPWIGGMFKHWTIEAKDNPTLSDFTGAWILRVLPSYTGMINIETIGGHIIEAQIRFADQWCDLNGKGWLEAVAGLYATGQWLFDEPLRIDAYSVPLFIRHGKVPMHPSHAVQDRIRAMPNVNSLQITFFEGKPDEAHTMPPGGFRLAVINATNFDAGVAARAELAKTFDGFEVMLP